MSVAPDVARLLDKLRGGDQGAFDELVRVLYDELHRIASRHLHGERPSHTLQTTALVHEAYLKLVGDSHHGFADRVHFLAVASRVMRQVLVDHARARAAKKRTLPGEADLPRIAPASGSGLDGPSIEPVELLDLDRALDALSQEDRPLAQLIEMRYFGGMTAEETAEALGRSVHVVRHDLRLAQAWLRRAMNG